MLKKTVLTALSIISLTAFYPAYAEPDLSCAIDVAVNKQGSGADQYVAFNAQNDYGFSGSSWAISGGAPQTIKNVPCAKDAPLTISATPLPMANGMIKATAPTPVGSCVLKSGPVVLGEPHSSVIVIFPDNFICNN